MTAPRRVLVANRGVIAMRIIRVCRAVGSESVAVYSETDKDAQWMRAAAVHIGRSAAGKSYRNAEALLDAAKGSGVDAVHPGCGFLSERADFARVVKSAGDGVRRPTR
jgi:acetyl-CoA carboxylase biotin carboxylase subunit